MKRCLFTYDALKPKEKDYSHEGLKKLSRKLKQLAVFPYDQDEQIEIAKRMVRKISIQGIQPKFSVALDEKSQAFKEVENKGKFILKPQVRGYKEMPENEDLTMHLVAMAKLKVPWHGLVRCTDDSLSYVVKRFDRVGKNKIPMEDFSQLIGASRDTKYDVSTERVVETIEKYSTFPTLDNFRLFQRILLAFLLGNEDLHLKNLALITLDGKTELSPVYDFVNSTIVNPNSDEELALSIGGKKKGFTKKDLLKDFAEGVLFLPTKKIAQETERLLKCLTDWKKIIAHSFLSNTLKQKYTDLLEARMKRLS